MESEGNSIKLSAFLKYGLMEVKKAPSQIFDLVLSMPLWTLLYISQFLKERIFRKLMKFFKVLPEEKQNLQSACKR